MNNTYFQFMRTVVLKHGLQATFSCAFHLHRLVVMIIYLVHFLIYITSSPYSSWCSYYIFACPYHNLFHQSHSFMQLTFRDILQMNVIINLSTCIYVTILVLHECDSVVLHLVLPGKEKKKLFVIRHYWN